jgi:hypothetical protein
LFFWEANPTFVDHTHTSGCIKWRFTKQKKSSNSSLCVGLMSKGNLLEIHVWSLSLIQKGVPVLHLVPGMVLYGYNQSYNQNLNGTIKLPKKSRSGYLNFLNV